MEIVRKWKDKSGQFALHAAFALLAAVVALALGLSVFHVYHVVGSVRELTDSAVLAVAAVNVAEHYGGAREADGAARHKQGAYWYCNFNTDDVFDTLTAAVDASDIDYGKTIYVDDAYYISDFDSSYGNYSLDGVQFKTTLTVTVPLKIGTIATIPISVPTTVWSTYDSKF